jgi:hypothetical protein
MGVCLVHRYRGLAVLVRSYRSPQDLQSPLIPRNISKHL